MKKTRFRLTAKGVSQLSAQPAEASSSNYEVSDEVEIGLKIAVFKSGRKSWRLRYMFEGQKGTITYGTYPSISIDQARELARKSKSLIADGIDPKQEKLHRKEAITLETFVKEIYLPFAEKERRSIRDIHSRLNSKILPAFGKKKLHHIHHQEVRQFVDKLATDISGITANRTKALLSSLFRTAIEHGLMTDNPARGIAKKRESGPRKRFMSDAEVTRFLPVLQEEVNKKNMSAEAIFILFFTGLRRSEALGMTWNNLDLENRSYFIPCPKNGHARTVPLNSLVVTLLQRIKDERGRRSKYVFPSSKSSNQPRKEVRKTLETLMKRAQISEKLTTHDLRRGFSSMLANVGEDLRTIGELIGHKDLQTTQKVYAHLENNTLRNASERVVTKVEELLVQHP